MSRLLIVYASRYGQTAKIADRIGDLLRRRGHTVTVASVAHNPAIGDVDVIVVGASVTMGRHQPSAAAFVQGHIGELRRVPSAFFSVSGAAADPHRGDEASRYVTEFLASTGWHPTETTVFGGAMAYTKYPWWLRWVMRLMSGRQGGPTDTSRDHEFTDWAHVDAFAARIASTAPATAQRS